MAQAKKILFVCTGNICRSAMAEHLLRHLAKTRGLALETSSRGTAAESYYEVPEVVRCLLAAKGVPPFEHKARFLTREALSWADVVFAMTEMHAETITDAYPEFTSKVHLFREAAGFGPGDVEDPMGQPDEFYEKCLAIIEESLEALIKLGFEPAKA
jgi:protein-tyrosine phosphatase